RARARRGARAGGAPPPPLQPGSFRVSGFLPATSPACLRTAPERAATATRRERPCMLMRWARFELACFILLSSILNVGSEKGDSMMRGLKWGLVVVCVVGALGGAAAYLWKRTPTGLKARAGEIFRRAGRKGVVRVEVVCPTRGALERKSSQPGTIHAYESIDVYAEVSGYLKTQPVDIGHVVNKGDLLVEIDVPELHKQLQKAKAIVRQAQAREAVMEAAVARAEAECAAAKNAIPRSKEVLNAANAMRRFRELRYQRHFR